MGRHTKTFRWRGRVRRSDGNGRPLTGVSHREFIKVSADVHAKVVRVARMLDVTVREAMERMFEERWP